MINRPIFVTIAVNMNLEPVRRSKAMHRASIFAIFIALLSEVQPTRGESIAPEAFQ